MNSAHHLLVAVTTTTAPAKNSGSSSLFLLVIIALLGGFYILRIRPNQQKRMQALRQSRAFEVGDEVVAGGMVGTVIEIGDGEVEVEVSDGMVVRFVPQAVQSRAAYAAAAARGARGRAALPPSKSSPAPVDDEPEGEESDAWPSEADDVSSNGTGFSAGPVTDATSGDGGATPSGGDR